MKKVISVTFFVFVLNTMVFGVAETPKYPYAVVWQPFYWQWGDCGGDCLTVDLNWENAEWEIYRYQDTIGNDDDVEDCTRQNADILGWESGVTLIASHTSYANLVLASTTNQSPMDTWKGGTSGDYLIVDSGIYSQFNYNLYFVAAKPLYCSSYWKADHDQAKSIVWLGTCFGYKAFVDPNNSIGGNTIFAYNELWYDWYATDMTTIFNNMCGGWGDGYYRTAREAYDILSPTSGLKIEGGNSTIAPAVRLDENHNYVVGPIGPMAGSSGTGYIEFDTKMDTSISATDALKWSPTGLVTISNINWFGDHIITFSYCGIGNYVVQMTADAGYCLAPSNAGGNYMELNGDRINGNLDDFVWSFSN